MASSPFSALCFWDFWESLTQHNTPLYGIKIKLKLAYLKDGWFWYIIIKDLSLLRTIERRGKIIQIRGGGGGKRNKPPNNNATAKQANCFHLWVYLGVWSAAGSLQAKPGLAGLITGFSTAVIHLRKLRDPIIPSRHISLPVCTGSKPGRGSPSIQSKGNLPRDNEERTVSKTHYILLTCYTSARKLFNQ